MINDSQIRLDALEASYKRLQASHAKLLADYQSSGGLVAKSHLDGSIDPYDEEIKIVIENPKFLTKDELANDLLKTMLSELKPLIDSVKKQESKE